MANRYFLLGFLGSLAVHAAILTPIILNIDDDAANSATENTSTQISMEMMAAATKEHTTEPQPQAVNTQKDIVADPTIKKANTVEKIIEPKQEIVKPTKPEVQKDPPINEPKEIKKEVVKSDQKASGSAQISSKAANISTNKQTSANPNLTGSGKDESAIAAYMQSLRREIESKKQYSRRAQMLRMQGTVTIGFGLSDNGSIINIRVIKSSGHTELDNLALKALENAKSVGPLPAGISRNISLPINFTVR